MSVESPSFVDTNVLVYAADSTFPKKKQVAERLIDELITRGTLVSSVQVMQELYVTLTRKARFVRSAEQAWRYLEPFGAFPIYAPDFQALRHAMEVSVRFQLSFWDSLIVVAASRLGAATLYTEDLHDGMIVLNVQIVNPFRDL